jgi:LPS O-antigen subunit length determinant protein (WzzB/FepE family)
MNSIKDETANTEDYEISLIDIYGFFVTGWKTIVLFVLVGLGIGVTTAFVVPEKFEASALIEMATVGILQKASTADSDSSGGSRPVESKDILAEKLNSPTYFSNETIEICGFADQANPAFALAEALKISVQRNSSFVSASFKAFSRDEAVSCIQAVLYDVKFNQARLAEPMVNNLGVALKTLNEQLQAAKTEQKQLLIQNKERLEVTRQKLVAAQSFVDQFSKDALTFKFDNPQFSASALLLSTIISKQNEIKDLEILINQLEMQVDARLTNKDNEVRELTKQVNDIRNALSAPQTKEASFATPIYAPNQKVEPKRSIIVFASLFAGFMLSIVFLLGRKVWRNLETQRATKLSH